jgi:hypothetical protein
MARRIFKAEARSFGQYKQCFNDGTITILHLIWRVCIGIGKQVGLGYGGYRSWEQVVLVALLLRGAATREKNWKREREDQMGRVDANDLLSSWIQRGINHALCSKWERDPFVPRRAHIKKCATDVGLNWKNSFIAANLPELRAIYKHKSSDDALFSQLHFLIGILYTFGHVRLCGEIYMFWALQIFYLVIICSMNEGEFPLYWNSTWMNHEIIFLYSLLLCRGELISMSCERY